ncbi:hypothetical protein BH09SUM1_BH09SUM1_21570 [soil metagenome]
MSDQPSTYQYFSRKIPTGVMQLKTDLASCEAIQKNALPFRTWAIATMQTPDDEGFPMEAERQVLENAERELMGRVGSENTVFLGSISHGGKYVVVIHSKDRQAVGHGPRSRIRGSVYGWDVYVDEDPDYFFVRYKLMPTAKEQRRIKDAEVINKLTAANDHLEAPRPLTFYALFSEKELADSAMNAFTTAGFRTAPASSMPGKGDYSWSLMLQKSSAADPMSIEQISAKAEEICHLYGGHYDGWSCEPVAG